MTGVAPSIFQRGRDEFKRFEEISTEIALVTSGIDIATGRALTFDESVCQKGAVLLAVELGCHSLFEVAIPVELHKDLLRNVGLQLGCGAAEYVEADVEPIIDLRVDGMILVTMFLGVHFSTSARALAVVPYSSVPLSVQVSQACFAVGPSKGKSLLTTNVKDFDAPATAVSRENVR